MQPLELEVEKEGKPLHAISKEQESTAEAGYELRQMSKWRRSPRRQKEQGREKNNTVAQKIKIKTPQELYN